MESATTYTLQRVSWQYFGTLTFKSARLPEKARLRMWFALARRICRWYKIPFQSSVWALRQESGEITGRKHFHFLFAGLPPSVVNVSSCMSMKSFWETIGGGMARIRMYDSTQQGVDYLLKCLAPDAGGNLYETCKFSHACDEVLLSHSMSDTRFHNRVSL